MDALSEVDLSRLQLDGPVIGPSHAEYERRRQVWNGTVQRHPLAIVRPTCPSDVAKVVGFAAERDLLLAVRGGGHSLPGLSTCDGGIVLDLSLMNGIAVDAGSRTAEVGGGALLGDLDAAGAPFGLVTPAGVVSHTGVGGLTLGGGMGWLSRRFGLTIDSLLAADIVLADGRRLRTSAEEEPDLFWAIRGGGGNFGVVTKFTFRMHPLGKVMIGRWVYPPEQAFAALRRYGPSLATAPRELTSVAVITPTGLSVTALWSGAEEAAEAALGDLGALGRPSSAEIGGATFLELQKSSDDRMRWGRRYYAKGGFLRELGEPVIDALQRSMAVAPNDEAEVYILQLGGAVGDVEDGATPYAGRDAGYYWIVEPVWDDPGEDEACLSWGRETAARLAAHSMRTNYINEQSDLGIASSAYGAEKYARLARLKGRYDPGNLFRLNQNIEPVQPG